MPFLHHPQAHDLKDLRAGGRDEGGWRGAFDVLFTATRIERHPAAPLGAGHSWTPLTLSLKF